MIKWFTWLIGALVALALLAGAVIWVAGNQEETSAPAEELTEPATAEEALDDSEEDLKEAELLEAEIEASLDDSSDQDLADIYEELKGL